MDRRSNQPNNNRTFYYNSNSNDYDSSAEYYEYKYEQELEQAQKQQGGQRDAKTWGSTMGSWLGSKEFQFGATALVSGAVVAGAILGYQHVRRRELVEDLKSSIPALGKEHQADRVCSSLHVLVESGLG